MNTVKSFWVGWGSLVFAGAGAYVLAKKNINADRRARHEESQRNRDRAVAAASLEHSEDSPGRPISAATMGGGVPNEHGSAARPGTVDSPGQEARHAPADESPKMEKSKYESSAPFRSPKGDRFS